MEYVGGHRNRSGRATLPRVLLLGKMLVCHVVSGPVLFVSLSSVLMETKVLSCQPREGAPTGTRLAASHVTALQCSVLHNCYGLQSELTAIPAQNTAIAPIFTAANTVPGRPTEAVAYLLGIAGV